jgi:hypothetical protein
VWDGPGGSRGLAGVWPVISWQCWALASVGAGEWGQRAGVVRGGGMYIAGCWGEGAEPGEGPALEWQLVGLACPQVWSGEPALSPSGPSAGLELGGKAKTLVGNESPGSHAGNSPALLVPWTPPAAPLDPLRKLLMASAWAPWPGPQWQGACGLNSQDKPAHPFAGLWDPRTGTELPVLHPRGSLRPLCQGQASEFSPGGSSCGPLGEHEKQGCRVGAGTGSERSPSVPRMLS